MNVQKNTNHDWFIINAISICNHYRSNLVTKDGPWSKIHIPPELDAEHQVELKNKRIKEKEDRKKIEEKIQKQMDDVGYYQMEDDDDVIEILETIMEKEQKRLDNLK
jgi:CelD/BcsL family acetyltransferase involved in cellulose biosynthesis